MIIKRAYSRISFFNLVLVFLLGLNVKAQLTVSVTVTPNNPCDTCVNLTVNASGGIQPYTYQWYVNNSLVSTAQNTSYCNSLATYSGDSIKIIVSDASSQQGYDILYSGSILPTTITDIDFCMITVDSATGKCQLIWNQSTNAAVASYIIYKKNSSSIWVKIANVPKASLSSFIDNSSNPTIATEWYNLSVADSCGLQTPWSSGMAINSIYLAASPGIFPAWNLSWNWTQGYPIAKYRIWRGTTTSIPILIDSVSNSVYAYTDLTPPANVSKYIIEAVSSANCNPSIKNQASLGYNSSFSNIAPVTVSGMSSFATERITRITPNPLNEHSILYWGEELINAKMIVFNSIGQIIQEIHNVSGKEYRFSRKMLMGGIYFAQITDGKKSFSGKLIVMD